MIITVPTRRGTPKKIEAIDAMAKVRRVAVKRLPYLGKMIWPMRFIESTHAELATMAVDAHLRVYFNPKHVEECLNENPSELDGMSDAAVAGIIHEALHPFLRHRPRGKAIGATDHKLVNIGGDFENNLRIVEAGIKLWSKDILPEHYGLPRGLAMEEYYRLLEKQQQQSGGGGRGSGQPKPGQGGGQQSGQQGGAPGQQSPQQAGGGGGKPHAGHAHAPGQTCSGGSGVTGQPAPWELAEGDPKLPPGLSEGEIGVVVAATAKDIRDYAAKHPGAVPAGLLRWAEEIADPPAIAWEDLIGGRVRYYVDARRGVVTSYARPSRRDAPGGLILPVHRAPHVNVALVVDTSGSMSTAHDIPKALAVVHDAARALGKVSVVPCDAQAYEAVEVAHIDDLRDFLKGGGGTDMPAGIRNAADLNPDVIVVCTDGYTDWPAEEPDVPVIVVLTRDSAEHYPPPAWADVIPAYD